MLSEWNNKYGETWRFFDDPVSPYITGQDVDWEEYLVVDGFTSSELELHKEEIEWICNSWVALGSCPLCLNKDPETEGHHVVWRCDGGTNHHKNILQICKSCHALLTFGSDPDARPRDCAAFYFQVARYGADFLIESGFAGARGKKEEVQLSDLNLREEALERYRFWRRLAYAPKTYALYKSGQLTIPTSMII